METESPEDIIKAAWKGLKVARSTLIREKIKEDKLKEITFVNQHDNIALANIRAWRVNNGIKEANVNHSCNYECFLNKIDIIYEKYHLYGCRAGGVLHACNCNEINKYLVYCEQIVTDCKYTYTASEGVTNCCYSGMVTGITIYNQRYGKVSRSKDNEAVPSSYDCIDEDHLYIVAQPIESKTRRNDTESGMEPKRAKRIKKISYDADNEQTNRFKITCSGVITDLLFNKSSRQRIDEGHTEDMYKRAKQKLREYFKMCESNNMLPNANTSSRIFERYMNSKTRLLVLNTDNRIIDYYSGIILKLWEMIFSELFYDSQKTDKFSKFHFKFFTLGILYMMKDGISVRSYEGCSEYSSCHSTPEGSLSSSCDSIRSDDSRIRIETLEENNNKINVMVIPDDDFMDSEDEDFESDFKKITLIEPDQYLTLNLPSITDMKDISCSISNKKCYTKNDVTRGLNWIQLELRNFKNMKKVYETKQWLDSYVEANDFNNSHNTEHC